MTGSVVLDSAGRGRSPATMPGFHRGRPPRNKGLRFPADPPTVEEIVAVMRCAGDRPYGLRTRALIVLLWRAGLRISEALSLAETDLDPTRGSIVIRRGKGGRRREVGLDAWAWQHVNARLEIRRGMPVGALLAWSRARHKADRCPRQQRARRCGASRSPRACADASLRISCGTLTRSRWPVRASRSWSSSANSATRTSVSPASISKRSTAARSSTPFTADQRQCSPRAQAYDDSPRIDHARGPSPRAGITARARGRQRYQWMPSVRPLAALPCCRLPSGPAGATRRQARRTGSGVAAAALECPSRRAIGAIGTGWTLRGIRRRVGALRGRCRA